MWSENQWSSKNCEQQAVNQSRILCRCKALKGTIIMKHQKTTRNDENSVVKSTTTVNSSGALTTVKSGISDEQTTLKAEVSTSLAAVATTIVNPSEGLTTVKSGSTNRQTTLKVEVSTNPTTVAFTQSSTPKVMESSLKTDVMEPTTHTKVVLDTTTIKIKPEITIPPKTFLTTETTVTYKTENSIITTPSTLNTENSNTFSQKEAILTTKASTDRKQTTENTSVGHATGTQSTTIEVENFKTSTAASKQNETEKIEINLTTTTAEKTVNKGLENKNITSGNSENGKTTKVPHSIDKIKEQTATVISSVIVTKENQVNSSSANVVDGLCYLLLVVD